MVAHSDDDELGDQRIVTVPAQDHQPGTMRDVFDELYRYPRIVTADRGSGYDTRGYPKTVPIGQIPQVPHTYAYHDGNYGIMNEHNLMIGECTNRARYQPQAVTVKQAKATGQPCRLFYSQELSRVALERCTRAREAVLLMGELIETYGYFSTGETLLVADADEAWVFEMCALPHEVYHSVWVAARVPDGEVFVAANEFRIRDVVDDRPEDFLYSRMLKPGLEELKWWRPEDGPLDWLATVSPGEYAHPYYALRRVWRVLDRVNPGLQLSPWAPDGYTRQYPFSVRPKRRLDVRDVFALYRDHYEGTQFDLTRGVAAGPYHDPSRFFGPYEGDMTDPDHKPLLGAWERPISVYYQGYTYVCQTRSPEVPQATRGVVWFGPDVAATTCFVPLLAGSPAPLAYQSGSPQVFDTDSAWWAFDFVANWARLNYALMTANDIFPLQQEWDLRQQHRLQQWDDECRDTHHQDACRQVAKLAEENAAELLKAWRDLGYRLIAKYSDGYRNTTELDHAEDLGYPPEWLRAAGYARGPVSYAGSGDPDRT
jgi:dipeptidase